MYRFSHLRDHDNRHKSRSVESTAQKYKYGRHDNDLAIRQSLQRCPHSNVGTGQIVAAQTSVLKRLSSTGQYITSID
ncbi:MAG: hypothetical protein FWE95_11730 [Planctomycetaceae bacterium]|nr:hypothetical protein [Planctomycetaceae bacterium]